MKSESNRPITIEDLLRLKRAEKPPAEFWDGFDRQLRAKQLAALVEKRPWWQDLPRAFGGLLRLRVALGATAALAVTIFSIREYQARLPAVESQAPVDMPLTAAAGVAHEPVGAAEIAAAAVESGPASEPVMVAQHEPSAGAIELPPVEVVEPVAPSTVIPVLAAVAPESEPQIESPAARQIAANLAAVQTSDVIHARRLLDVASGFEQRAMPVRVAVEPLQQMTPPGESRRSRILTAMVSKASLDASMQTTARAASRIDEERLYDQIHRFGARGDRVHVKF